MKRVVIATLSGVLFGFVCFGLAVSGSKGALPWPVGVQIVLSRSLIGVAIGISTLRMGHWTLHGAVMGLLFSLPMAFSGLMAEENPEFGPTEMWIATVVMGMIYGLLIEVITSGIFRAKRATPQPAPVASAETP
jgi:hypothetical protein